MVVKIGADGWRLTYDCPFKFYQPPGFHSLPEPVTGGGFGEFQNLLGIDDTTIALVVAFMLTCLRPNGPYMWLAIEGEQGSGKSVASTMIRQTIDPHASPKLRLADNERDLMLHAQENHLLTYDNASGMKNDISDALCSLATGGGIAARKYYTDDQLRVFTFVRPFIINGIADFAHRPDLLDRAIPLRLRAMPDGARRPEKEMFAEYQRIRPRLLGFLLDCVCCALKNEASANAPTDIRMADSAAWLVAAEPATGLRPGAMLEAIRAAQGEIGFDRVMSDRVVIDIMHLVDTAGVVGHVGALYDLLSIFWNPHDKSTPKSPALLSRHLARLTPALRKQGVVVDLSERSNKGKLVKIWKVGQDPERLRTLLDSDRSYAARETVQRKLIETQAFSTTAAEGSEPTTPTGSSVDRTGGGQSVHDASAALGKASSKARTRRTRATAPPTKTKINLASPNARATEATKVNTKPTKRTTKRLTAARKETARRGKK